jgi:hypothetical protein
MESKQFLYQLKKWYKLIFCLILVLLLSWWLFKPSAKNTEAFAFKLPNSLKQRTFHNLTTLDTILITEPVSSVYLHGDSIYLPHYESDTTTVCYTLSKKKETHLKLFNKNESCYIINGDRNYTAFLLSRKPDDMFEVRKCSAYTIEKNGSSQLYPIDIPFQNTCQLDDSSYYCILKHTPITYLMKYNYRLKKFTDSLNLCKVYTTTHEHLDFILGGKIELNNSALVFKSMYSSECLLVNKRNFNDYERYNTLDSLPLPEFKAVEYAGGLTQFELEPKIYVTYYLKKHLGGYLMLSDILFAENSSKADTKNTALDVYDSKIKYLHSYKLPMLKGKYFATAVDFDTTTNTFFVLYDDYHTLIKFHKND